MRKRVRRAPKNELPMQPICVDDDGVARFRSNKIVKWLHTSGRVNLNDIVTMSFPQEDIEQFWQLLGYSIGGYEELSFISDKAVEAAKDAAEITVGCIYRRGE